MNQTSVPHYCKEKTLVGGPVRTAFADITNRMSRPNHFDPFARCYSPGAANPNAVDPEFEEQILGDDSSMLNQQTSVATNDTEKDIREVDTPQCSVEQPGGVADHDHSRPKRKPRTVFSRNQLTRMKEAFNSKPYLTTEERRNLANELKISSEQIKVWFQNHRSKLKRQGRLIASQNSHGDHHAGVQQSVAAAHTGNSSQNFMLGHPQLSQTLAAASYLKPYIYNPNDPQAAYDYFNSPFYAGPECYPNMASFYSHTQNTPVMDNVAGYIYNGAKYLPTYLNQSIMNYSNGKTNQNAADQNFCTQKAFPEPR